MMNTFQLPAPIVSAESLVSTGSLLSAESLVSTGTLLSAESLVSAASYDSPVKTHKPPNEVEAPGAPQAPRALAKRKTPDDPNENSSTCRTLKFPVNENF